MSKKENHLEKYKDNYTRLGKAIAKIRKDNKMSQQKFAEELNISREHIAKIECAKRGTSLPLLFEIQNRFNISFGDFL